MLLGVPLTSSVPAQTADPSETIKTLSQRIEDLEQRIKILDRKRELDQEAVAERAKTTATVSAGASGFSIRSADTNFVLKVRGYVQADARFYPDDNSAGTANDSFLLRRVRPIFEGTVFDKYDYRVMLDLGSGAAATAANNGFVQDAYVNARFWPAFQIQAGKFKEPVGLERLQSGANLLFVERGYPTQILPNRDVGFQIQGDLFHGALNYAMGAFNGVADGGSGDFETADDEKDVAWRLFSHPFKNSNSTSLPGLGIGVSGTFGNQEGALRTYASPGQQRFFAYRTSTVAGAPNVLADGDHWRLSPQGYYYWGPFGLFAEYAISAQNVRQAGGGAGAGSSANLVNSGWQVSASYILTGEDNSFKALTPTRPFTIGGDGWGAWEVTARAGQLDIDNDSFPVFANATTSATEATSWGIGLNWHLNKNVKANLNYEQTNFKGGDANALTANGEKVVLTRIQFSF